MTWKEIWRAKSEYSDTQTYLNGCYNEQGYLIKAELFFEKHHLVSGRTTTVSMGLNKEQLEILLRVLGVELK